MEGMSCLELTAAKILQSDTKASSTECYSQTMVDNPSPLKLFFMELRKIKGPLWFSVNIGGTKCSWFKQLSSDLKPVYSKLLQDELFIREQQERHFYVSETHYVRADYGYVSGKVSTSYQTCGLQNVESVDCCKPRYRGFDNSLGNMASLSSHRD